MKRGIDVSEAQGIIDWEAVKESGEVEFAILRSSYGWNTVLDKQLDKKFRDNVAGCEKYGIPYGIYHYSYCVRPENARKEAQYFLKAIEGTNPKYRLWFDIEDPSQVKLGKEKCTQIAADFCDEVEKAGYQIGIYSYKTFLENYLDMDRLSKYDVWLAHVVDRTDYKGNYGMWQYSWKGRIPGIKGNVDLDFCYRNYESTSNSEVVSPEILTATVSLDELLKLKEYLSASTEYLDSLIDKISE